VKRKMLVIKLALNILIFCLLPFFECSDSSKPSDFDYEIYELIDRLNKLKPQHSTLYDLLGVKPSASSEEISRQFRRLSFPYHPDKTQGDAEANKVFMLYSGASQVLKVPETRKRYEWILHEAPPWHRSQVYLIRQLQKRSEARAGKSGQKEISIIGLIAFMFGSLTLAQLLIQWTRFLINRYWIWSGQRALKSIPAQELRRMEKKALRSDLTFLANVDSNFENLQAARAEPLPFPSPTDLFLFKIPLNLILLIISPFRREAKEVEETVKKTN
jgi:curved DNA-binding protein CbpA